MAKPQEKTKHSFLSTRIEKFEVENAAITRFEAETKDPNQAWKKLKQGIQKWMASTKTGRIAYESASGDFNIGDALNEEIWKDSELKAILEEEGITGFVVESLNDIEQMNRSYDEHLFLDADEIEANNAL